MLLFLVTTCIILLRKYMIDSKVIETLQTIEGKLNDSKVLLGCKESTHICNGMPSKYRNMDEHINDASFSNDDCMNQSTEINDTQFATALEKDEITRTVIK